MDLKAQAMAAGQAMAESRNPQSLQTPVSDRVPVEGPLPQMMPLAEFLKVNPTLEDREALSPGVTGQLAYKNISTTPQGVMVKITGQPSHVTPGVADYAIADMKAKEQAALQVDPNAGPSIKTAPLTEMLRTYGPAVVSSMYPGIFEQNGHDPYLKKFGTNANGELLVPSYGDMDPQPLPSPIPVEPKPVPAAALVPAGGTNANS